MNEYALLIADEFKEIRRFEKHPPDIPHKKVAWLAVVREYGEPFTGVENGAWVIRTVDPATIPPPVPRSVSPRQARLALMAAGKLDAANAAVAAADEATKIAWEFSTEVVRDDPGVIAMGAAIGLGAKDIDALFIDAAGR